MQEDPIYPTVGKGNKHLGRLEVRTINFSKLAGRLFNERENGPYQEYKRTMEDTVLLT